MKMKERNRYQIDTSLYKSRDKMQMKFFDRGRRKRKWHTRRDEEALLTDDKPCRQSAYYAKFNSMHIFYKL